MLSRFLDKKNQNKGDAKRNAEARLKQGVSPEQGSLLDLFGTANSAQSRPNAHGLVAPPPIAPGSGSLLNEIDNEKLPKADVFSLGLTLYECATLSSLPKNSEDDPIYEKFRSGNVPYINSYSKEFNQLIKVKLIKF